MTDVQIKLMQASERLSRRLGITRATHNLLGEAIEDMERDLAELRLLISGNQDLPLKAADSAEQGKS
jgi:hypothetical protein